MRLIISCKIRKVNGFNNKPFRLKKRPCSKKQGRFKFIPSLQMQHSILDLCRPALVPELGADITAGAAGNVQLVLVTVAFLTCWIYSLRFAAESMGLPTRLNVKK